MTSRTAGFAMNSSQWNSQHMNTCRTRITSNKISTNFHKEFKQAPKSSYRLNCQITLKTSKVNKSY